MVGGGEALAQCMYHSFSVSQIRMVPQGFNKGGTYSVGQTIETRDTEEFLGETRCCRPLLGALGKMQPQVSTFPGCLD